MVDMCITFIYYSYYYLALNYFNPEILATGVWYVSPVGWPLHISHDGIFSRIHAVAAGLYK